MLLNKLIRIIKHPIEWVQWKYESSRIRRIYDSLGRRRCYICKHRLRNFRSYRGGTINVSPFILELKLIRGDIDNFLCPYCGCTDR